MLALNYQYVLRFDPGIKPTGSYAYNMSKGYGIIMKDASGN